MIDRNILLVIDMQNDFINGTLGTKEAEAIVPFVEQFIRRADDKGFDIIFTQDTHTDTTYLTSREGRKLPIKHCIYGTKGWEIPKDLQRAAPHAVYLCKSYFGAADWHDFFNHEDTGTVHVIGLCTDICVITNVLTLKTLYPNYNYVVHSGYCAGSTPEKHKAALEVLRSCQVSVFERKENENV